MVALGKPLLQNAVGSEMHLGDGIELLGVEKTGSGSLDGRRRIDGNDVILLVGALHEKAPVINYDMGKRRAHDLIGVGMEKREDGNHTRHQFHGRRRHIPRQGGAVSCSHSETDDESALGRSGKERQGQVGDHLGDRREPGHAHAIDQKRLLHSGGAGRRHRGRAVAAHLPRDKPGFIILGDKNQNERDQPR